MNLRGVKAIMLCDLLRLRKSSGFLISTIVVTVLLGIALSLPEGMAMVGDILGLDAIPRFLVFVTTIISASFAYNALMIERESGSFELLSTVPLSRFDILLGKLFAPIVLGLSVCIIPFTLPAIRMFPAAGVAAMWTIGICTSAALTSILFLFFVWFKTREVARLGWVVGLVFAYPRSTNNIPGIPSYFAAEALEKIMNSTFFVIPEAVYILIFTTAVLFLAAFVFSRKETALLK